MYYSSGCNCGCNYDCGCNTVPSTCCTTSSTTTTTTIPCIGEHCDEIYNCECVVYNGPDLTCYGILNGTGLCDILEIIISHLPGCAPVDICFTIAAELFAGSSCLTQPSVALWNGKVYYQPLVGDDCSTTLGYVYWSGTRWEFANGLGGGTELYAYLPIPSEYPITSPAGPWVVVDSKAEMVSSTGGPCPTTTTTTAAPCPCDCITFVNPTDSAYVITWLDCNIQEIVIYNLEANTTHVVCGTNPFVTNASVTFTIGDPCVLKNGKCTCYVPTTTTSTSTTTTTTIAPCRCYSLVYTPSSEFSPIAGYSYTNCNGLTVGGSLAPFDSVNLCARENSVVAFGIAVYDNGLCSSNCTSTTTTTTTIIPASTTTTSTTTTFPPLVICNCLTFIYPKEDGGAQANVTYVNCSGTTIMALLNDGNVYQACGSLPTASLPAVTIIQGGPCIGLTCPPCACYNIYNTIEATRTVTYYDCETEDLNTISVEGGIAVTICALQNSIVAAPQLIVTPIGTSCPSDAGCNVVAGFFEEIEGCEHVWNISNITFGGVDIVPSTPYNVRLSEFYVSNPGVRNLVITTTGTLSAGSISVIDSNGAIYCLPLASTMTFPNIAIDNITQISISIAYCDPCPPTFNVVNQTGNFTIFDVTTSSGAYFYVIDDGAIPCGPGDEAHGDGTTSSAVKVIVTGFGSGASTLTLYKNGIIQEIITFSTIGTYTFAAVPFSGTDIMLIQMNSLA